MARIKQVVIGFKVSVKDAAKVKAAASKEDLTVSQYLRRLLKPILLEAV